MSKNKSILNSDRIFIIAEAGVNHNGSLEVARKLIDAAVEAGADAVKFQTFKSENLVTESAPKAAYQTANDGAEESQFDMLKRLELDIESHETLMNYCTEKGILFLSTPFDLESIDLLAALGLPLFKIPSGEITNLPYLRKIAEHKRPVILSTGMATKEEIGMSLQALTEAGLPLEMITVLHCNTQYPTPMQDVNLLAMRDIGSSFKGVNVGYSDHTLGIEIPIAAASLGATLIEKHFTLDKTMDGPDHVASLDPQELIQMVRAVRNIEQALGDGEKKPTPSEEGNRLVVRKSIVALQPITVGETLSESNLTTKRPGTGLSPMMWDDVVGTVAKRTFAKDEIIEL